MKICHVIYVPRLSGAEILVRDLSLSHIAQGNKVTIISLLPLENSFANEVKKLEEAGTRLILPQVPLGKLSRLTFIAKELKRLNPDVVIAHSVIPSAYVRLALKLTIRLDIPVITVLHDASQDDYAAKYWCYLEKWLIPAPSCLIALTNAAKNNYQRRIGDRTKIEIIPNGINLNLFQDISYQRDRIRREIFQVKDEETVLLQIGRFGDTKQQHLSVEAFAHAWQESNYSLSAKLFLVGLVEDTQYYQNLVKKVGDYGLAEKIFFWGARSNVPELLAGADVYLMPSKREAYSVAFLEALASGITIIASDIPAFKHGQNFSGVTAIAPDNVKLFSEEITKAMPLSLSRRWKRNLNDYSIDKTSSAYIQIFDRLANHQK